MSMEKRLASFSEIAREAAEAGPAPLLSGKPADRSSGNLFRSQPAAPARSSAPPFSEPPPSQPAASPASSPKDSQSSGARQRGGRESSRMSDRRAEFRALTEKVRHIQTPLVLQALGAVGNQDGKANKYKLPGFGNIETSGQAWYCWNEGVGKGGPIDLVMWVRNCEFPDAVRWLAEEFGERVDDEDIKAAKEDSRPKEKKTFDPPMRVDKNLPFVKHYLHYNRAIPMELIDDLVAQRKIYADEDRNCIFFSEGIAEIRSSFDGDSGGRSPVKKLADGSTRNFGFLVLADPERNEGSVAICESSIDSMSYRVLNPGRSAISAAGAGFDFPLQIAEQTVANERACIAAFDADNAGDKAAQALFNHFYLKLWLKHRMKAEQGQEIDEDKILELLMSKVVDFDMAVRPGDPERNLLFFNDPQPFADPAKPPLIVLTIKENPYGIPQCSAAELPVHEKGWRYIVEKLRLTRDRPKVGKDWNETLVHLRAQAKMGAEEPSSKPSL